VVSGTPRLGQLSTRLAVLGSPISHSRSPALHRAAYTALSLDWRYDAIDVDEESLSGFLAGLDESWRGLSLTMPLKRRIVPALSSIDPLVSLTGVANTVLFDGATSIGFNTDVVGIVRAFSNRGIDFLDSVHILGAGATAASALVAASELGATRAIVSARSLDRIAPLVVLGENVGVTVTAGELATAASASLVPSAVINTLPGGTASGADFPSEVRERSALFEVAYDPWPSELSAAWAAPVIDGLDMLVEQALVQVRIFVNGHPDLPLTAEPGVRDAMRRAVAR
jgi:shikimate dehydrogenase